MTDLDEMERRIRGIFGRAGKELKAKWDDWMKDMDKELDGLQKAYEAAKASGDGAAIRKAGIALSRAKKDKIMGNKYYDQMVAQSAERLKEAQQQAMAYINGQMPRVYATSFNGSTAQIADGVPGRMGISFDLADESTVARLMRDPSMDLHDLTRSVSGTKMAAWNNRAISSEITQGIVQGDSIPRIAGRLMNVAGMDMKAATRTARTMTTGAENAGREDSYHRAQDMGIKMKQKWVASLDDRTRESHRQLDGEIREVGEPFSNGLRFPGDPYGPPEEVYNCRCTLIAVLDGFDRDKVERWNKLEDQSYEEWKAGGSVQKQNVGSVVSHIVQGSDISSTWQRRPDEFEFEINDVIDAQGFDGKPQIVNEEEFNKRVEESGFIAQRTYSAHDKETLDAYRDQLYNGEWYVDCRNGGAQYGQGMYCSANLNGELTDEIRDSMRYYGAGRREFNYVETFTLTDDAKIIDYNTLHEMQMDSETLRKGVLDNLFESRGITNENERLYIMSRSGIFVEDTSGVREWLDTLSDRERNLVETEVRGIRTEVGTKVGDLQHMDMGAFGALYGYDVVVAENGLHTIVLNRTKVIFLGGK